MSFKIKISSSSPVPEPVVIERPFWQQYLEY